MFLRLARYPTAARAAACRKPCTAASRNAAGSVPVRGIPDATAAYWRVQRYAWPGARRSGQVRLQREEKASVLLFPPDREGFHP